jgi:hypothetical protein
MVITTINDSPIDTKLEDRSIHGGDVKIKLISKNMVLVVRGLDDQVFEC